MSCSPELPVNVIIRIKETCQPLSSICVMRTNVLLPILLHVFCNKMLNFQTLRILLLSNSTQEFLLSLYLSFLSLCIHKKNPNQKTAKTPQKTPKQIRTKPKKSQSKQQNKKSGLSTFSYLSLQVLQNSLNNYAYCHAAQNYSLLQQDAAFIFRYREHRDG